MIMKCVIVCTIGLAMLACGNGPDKSPSSNKATTEKVEQASVGSAVNPAKSNSGLKATETTNQDPTMTKEQLNKAKSIISNVTAKDIKDVNAKKLFKSNCALCHGFKGKLKINGAKQLTKSTIPLHEAVAQVYFGKGLMNPYKGVLKDAEIVAVCQYIEKLRK